MRPALSPKITLPGAGALPRTLRSVFTTCWLCIVIGLAGLATGCTTTGKSYLPIDSQLRPWQPPEDLSSAPEKKGKK